MSQEQSCRVRHYVCKAHSRLHLALELAVEDLLSTCVVLSEVQKALAEALDRNVKVAKSHKEAVQIYQETEGYLFKFHMRLHEVADERDELRHERDALLEELVDLKKLEAEKNDRSQDESVPT